MTDTDWQAQCIKTQAELLATKEEMLKALQVSNRLLNEKCNALEAQLTYAKQQCAAGAEAINKLVKEKEEGDFSIKNPFLDAIKKQNQA